MTLLCISLPAYTMCDHVPLTVCFVCAYVYVDLCVLVCVCVSIRILVQHFSLGGVTCVSYLL